MSRRGAPVSRAATRRARHRHQPAHRRRCAVRPGRAALRALDEQDLVGELLVRSLVRAQLLLALRLLTVLAVLLGGLPLLFAARPGHPRPRRCSACRCRGSCSACSSTRRWSSAARVHLRLAERHERDFVELVERS